MKALKTLTAALALASAAPAFAGICCNYGSPNGPSMNGIAPSTAAQLRHQAEDYGVRPRQADEGDFYPLPAGEHGHRAGATTVPVSLK